MTDRDPEPIAGELVSDPLTWEKTDKWDEHDSRIFDLRVQGFSIRAIARQPEIPLSEPAVRERIQRRHILPSTEALVATQVERMERMDDLHMRVRATVARQRRTLIDPTTGDQVVVDSNPMIVLRAAKVELEIDKRIGELLGSFDAIQTMARERGEGDPEKDAAARDRVSAKLEKFLASREQNELGEAQAS